MSKKQLLNERMMQLAGIKYPQVMGFSSNSPTMNENFKEGVTLNSNDVSDIEVEDITDIVDPPYSAEALVSFMYQGKPHNGYMMVQRMGPEDWEPMEGEEITDVTAGTVQENQLPPMKMKASKRVDPRKVQDLEFIEVVDEVDPPYAVEALYRFTMNGKSYEGTAQAVASGGGDYEIASELSDVTAVDSDLNEHHGPGRIVTNKNPKKFYAEVEDALNRGETVICKCVGAMGEVIRVDGTSMIIDGPRGKGSTGFMGGDEVELIEAEDGTYVIQHISDNLNEYGDCEENPMLGDYPTNEPTEYSDAPAYPFNFSGDESFIDDPTVQDDFLNEHHGPGRIATNSDPDRFYAEVQDALDRGATVTCKCPGAMGEVEQIDGTSMIVSTPRGRGSVGFMGGNEVELVEDENGNYIIQNVGLQEHGWEKAKPLHENTVKEVIGVKRNITTHKPHKFILNERMMGFAGIIPLKPIGFATNAPVVDNSSFKQNLNEIDSDLSRQELYNKLPMLHSNVLMELAERYVDRPTGKSWGVVVEELTETYFANPEAKKAIHITLNSTGLI